MKLNGHTLSSWRCLGSHAEVPEIHVLNDLLLLLLFLLLFHLLMFLLWRIVDDSRLLFLVLYVVVDLHHLLSYTVLEYIFNVNNFFVRKWTNWLRVVHLAVIVCADAHPSLGLLFFYYVNFARLLVDFLLNGDLQAWEHGFCRCLSASCVRW